jgi:hypothetical protein
MMYLRIREELFPFQAPVTFQQPRERRLVFAYCGECTVQVDPTDARSALLLPRLPFKENGIGGISYVAHPFYILTYLSLLENSCMSSEVLLRRRFETLFFISLKHYTPSNALISSLLNPSLSSSRYAFLLVNQLVMLASEICVHKSGSQSITKLYPLHYCSPRILILQLHSHVS